MTTSPSTKLSKKMTDMLRAYFKLYMSNYRLFKKYPVAISETEMYFILGLNCSDRTVDAIEARAAELGLSDIVQECGAISRAKNSIHLTPGTSEWKEMYNKYAE